SSSLFLYFSSFFFTDPATSAIYTLSLHDALPIFAIAGSKVIVIAFSRCYDRVHDGQHIGVRGRFAGRGIVDVCRVLWHGITVIRSATGILVNDVDEVAIEEVAQKTSRVPPTTGNGTAPIGMKEDQMIFHGYCDGASMVLQVARIARASRIRSSHGLGGAGVVSVGEPHDFCRFCRLSVGRPGVVLNVCCLGGRRIVGR